MKLIYIISIIFIFNGTSKSQRPFIFSFEQQEIDFIADVWQKDNIFYFLEGKATNLGPGIEYDGISDLFMVDSDGIIIDTFLNINGFRTVYERILKIENNDIYLVGYIKTDSCKSSIVISKFNVATHQVDHLSNYDFCEHTMTKIRLVHGLDDRIFIEEIHEYGTGVTKNILEIDSTYQLKLVLDSVNWQRTLSIDFNRTGYLLAKTWFYSLYDKDFNFIKQIYKGFDIFYPNETHQPFGRNFILKHSIQDRKDWPEPGVHILLIDSNIVVKKKAIIFPAHSHGYTGLPFFDGLSIANPNEIWASAYFEPKFGYDDGFFSLAKLDSNLNILCQHFIGFDSKKYRLYGIRAFESGGAIVYGSRVREGHDINEGEDIYAIRVGENCELPPGINTGLRELDPLLSISAYPNPGINDLTFDVNGFDPTTLTVDFINGMGQVLFSKQDLTHSIQVPELPAGLYYYRISKKEKILGVGSWVKE